MRKGGKERIRHLWRVVDRKEKKGHLWRAHVKTIQRLRSNGSDPILLQHRPHEKFKHTTQRRTKRDTERKIKSMASSILMLAIKQKLFFFINCKSLKLSIKGPVSKKMVHSLLNKFSVPVIDALYMPYLRDTEDCRC